MVKSLGLECSTLTTRPLLHQFEILINLQSYIVPYCIFVYLTDTEIAELNLVGVRKIHPTPTVAQTVFDKSLSSKKKIMIFIVICWKILKKGDVSLMTCL